eukprot:s226_g11.t3
MSLGRVSWTFYTGWVVAWANDESKMDTDAMEALQQRTLLIVTFIMGFFVQLNISRWWNHREFLRTLHGTEAWPMDLKERYAILQCKLTSEIQHNLALCPFSDALLDLYCERQITVGTAGPHLPAPDHSGHCRTSTASSRSQWALPDLNREFQIAVGTAGPQPPDLNREHQIPVGTAGPQPRAPDPWIQWALPDLNREPQIPVGTAGPEPPDRMKAQTVWLWIASYVKLWLNDDKKAYKIQKRCCNGRAAISAIRTQLGTQLPISVMVQCNHCIMGLGCGYTGAAALVLGHYALLVAQIAQTVIVPATFQSLLDVCVYVSDPYGSDVIDFSFLSYHLALAKAAIATCWMAFDVSRPCQARYGLKPEEISQVSEELSNAWKVLGKSTAAGGFRPSNEWRRLQARLEGLKDQLPRDLRNSVEAFVSKGPGLSMVRTVRSSGKVGTAVDYLSWAVLAIFLLALSSEDGIGLLRFHVVPEAWQSVVKVSQLICCSSEPCEWRNFWQGMTVLKLKLNHQESAGKPRQSTCRCRRCSRGRYSEGTVQHDRFQVTKATSLTPTEL